VQWKSGRIAGRLGFREPKSRCIPPCLPHSLQTGMPRGRWHLKFKTPEQELEEFLRDAPSCLRDMFRVDSMSLQEQKEWRSSFNFWRMSCSWKFQHGFEKLLKRIPERWREYCRRSREVALLGVPRGRPGRRQTPLSKLAEMRELSEQGWNEQRIANRFGLTPEAVRKRLAAARRRLGLKSNS